MSNNDYSTINHEHSTLNSLLQMAMNEARKQSVTKDVENSCYILKVKLSDFIRDEKRQVRCALVDKDTLQITIPYYQPQISTHGSILMPVTSSASVSNPSTPDGNNLDARLSAPVELRSEIIPSSSIVVGSNLGGRSVTMSDPGRSVTTPSFSESINMTDSDLLPVPRYARPEPFGW